MGEPVRIDVPDADLDDLRSRLGSTIWPDEPEVGWSDRPLVEPAVHGGDASDAFDVVIPSVPG